jgi:ornithine cyclodeaminase
VATRCLARAEATVLAILGTGVQAAHHLDAMVAVRPITRVQLWGRNAATAAACGARLQARHPAVRGADIVCTLTAATEPVLRGEWLAPGCHVNAVGACTPRHRELDLACVVGPSLWVDTRAACLTEPGDIVTPMAQGHPVVIVGEIGQVLAEQCRGRESPTEVTVFKSVGAAVEDLFAAQHIFGALQSRAKCR